MSKAVMTIHGFLTTTDDFGRLNQYLDHYDEIAVVQIPGHNGKTNFSLFTMQSTINTVLSTFDTLAKKHDQVDVLGFSMGGALAQYLCARRPVGKVVLMAPSNKFLNVKFPFLWTKFFVNLNKQTIRQTEGSKRAKRRQAKAAAKPYWKDVGYSIKMAFGRLLPNISLATFSTFSHMMRMINGVVEDKGTIDTPCLLIHGGADELVPMGSITFVKKHFVNIQQYKVYDGVGHGMLYSHQDLPIIQDIAQFLCGQTDRQ